MILDKKDLPDDPAPSDAPPSYDDLIGNSVVQPGSGTSSGRFGGRFWRFGDEKRGLDANTSGAESSSNSTAGPSRFGSRAYPFGGASSSSSSTAPNANSAPPAPPIRPSKLSKSKGKSTGGISWLASFTSSHRDAETQRDVRATVLGLLRNLVQNAPSTSASTSPGKLDAQPSGPAVAAEGIIQSCEVACSRCGLSLSDVLQERSVEGHTPLYWAIVKRPRSARVRKTTHSRSRSGSVYLEDGFNSELDISEEDRAAAAEADALLHLLLAYTAPLNASTLSDLRLACLVAADNALLQRLRADPAVVLRSGAEAILHGSMSASAPALIQGDALQTVDVVKVYEDSSEEGDKVGAFVVKMKIRRFQKRMRVSGGVGVEFVARGRIWFLTFFVVPPNHLLQPLPNTYGVRPSPPTSSSTPSSQHTTPPHPLHPFHPANGTVSHTLLTRERDRRSSAPALGVGSWAVGLGLMEYGSACWVDGRVRVEEWDEEREEERLRLREERKRVKEERERVERGSEASGTKDLEKARLGLLVDVPGSFDSATPAISPNHTGTSSSAYTTQSSLPPSPSIPKPNTTKKRAQKQKTKPKPPIVLHLKTPNNAQLTVAPAPVYAGPGEDAAVKMKKELEKRWEGRIRSADGQVAQAQMCSVAGFEESLMGGSLQFDGSTYIAPDETLHATLEARLAKPESECVIC